MLVSETKNQTTTNQLIQEQKQIEKYKKNAAKHVQKQKQKSKKMQNLQQKNKSDEKQQQKCKTTLKNTRFFNDVCLSGASFASFVEASGRLVAIQTPLGRVLETM